MTIFLRILICILSTALAFGVYDFDFVVTLSGALTVIALYAIPAYMEMKGQQLCREIAEGDLNAGITQETDWTSHPVWLWSNIILGIVSFVGVIVELST